MAKQKERKLLLKTLHLAPSNCIKWFSGAERATSYKLLLYLPIRGHLGREKLALESTIYVFFQKVSKIHFGVKDCWKCWLWQNKKRWKAVSPTINKQKSQGGRRGATMRCCLFKQLYLKRCYINMHLHNSCLKEESVSFLNICKFSCKILAISVISAFLEKLFFFKLGADIV